ncbi:hypothetical protein [Actinomyces urogenitalis]|uniref:hypothetical protein n=1 Tax=Actinomyces urogenitalis TaxID=103621 RepID=UPI00242CCAFC|nr:hypothetical protein [Actinomyces urogenitalis]MCI7456329.1 hypothetical protein [Actinomyces urogenitalis]
MSEGLYGERGWSVRAGVWRVLGVEPASDLTSFDDLGPREAARLMEILPAAQLQDRQNAGPSLGRVLGACVASGGSMRLCGYVIAPQRCDERVTISALWVADADLVVMQQEQVSDDEDGAVSRRVWDLVEQRYDLDAEAMPDELQIASRGSRGGQLGTWMWWD